MLDSPNLKTSKFDMSRFRQDPALYYRALEEVKLLEVELSRPEVQVQFIVPFRTKFGERIVVTGDHAGLGHWDATQGLELQWHEGNIWRGTLNLKELPNFEYKYVCLGMDGARWEQGLNRKAAGTTIQKQGDKRVYLAEDEWRS